MSRRCRAKAANSSFSSARIREQRTPILTSLAPVFLFLGRQLELDRVALDHFQLGSAVGAGYDLTLFDVGRELDVGRALRTLRGYGGLPHPTSPSCGPPLPFFLAFGLPALLSRSHPRPRSFPLVSRPLSLRPPALPARRRERLPLWV